MNPSVNDKEIPLPSLGDGWIRQPVLTTGLFASRAAAQIQQ